MKKESKKRIDLYDIGDGLTLMNLIEKNDSGKMHHITTYIGIEGNGFVCVGNANDLDANSSQTACPFRRNGAPIPTQTA